MRKHCDQPSVRELWRDTPIVIVPFLWLLASVYNLALGLAFLIGGEDRISGPSFVQLRADGGFVPIGVAFCIGGVAIAISVVGKSRYLAIAFGYTGLLHLFLMAGFLLGAIAESGSDTAKGAWTGIPTYLAVAATHMALARLYWYFEREANDAA